MLRKPLALLLVVTPLLAAEPADEPAEAPQRETLGPYCACFETEPAMDFGGRGINSIQTLVSGLAGRTERVQRSPALQLAWELPLSLFLMLAQHEVLGHGSRAREFDLDPSYGLGLDFSAYTSIDKPPQSTEQVALLSSGGVEGTSLAGRRALLDLYQPGGGEGALAPLLVLYKLDLPLYVSQTKRPRAPSGAGDDFQSQYEDGNDMANYLVSRQGLRAGADPLAVWDRTYPVDYADPHLDRTFRDLREAAIWSLLDPAVVASVWGYARQHVGRGRLRVRPPVWQVHEALGLTAGTRASLGPGEVSRWLDVYLVNAYGVGDVYVRDLESTIDHTYGAGIGFHRAPIGSRVKLGGQLDWWRPPRALERPTPGRGFNAAAEIDVMVHRRFGFTAKLGHKSEGYLPGLPDGRGGYAGFGVLLAF